MRNVVFINSHPIQYFAPLYAYLNKQGINTSAWYCFNNISLNSFDNEFGVKIEWDIPLLEGYDFKFFKNYSPLFLNNTGFFGLINPGMLLELFKIPKSVIIVHGWNYLSHLLVILLGKFAGHTVCIRNDMPLNHEKFKKGFNQKIKKIGLKYFLFPRIDYFLYVGTQNKLFYESYDLQAKQLISCPYAVDNNRFQSIVASKEQIKSRLCIPLQDKVIIFSGKYIEKKRPLDLLKAFKIANIRDSWLIMIGEGYLRSEMESFIKNNDLKNVILTGFVNQTIITDYYLIADLFVMCSSQGENWGLSVNEAMNFNTPLILSDLTGCNDDLVINGVNGYKYKTGDFEGLANKITDILIEKKLTWGIGSREIINGFSYNSISEALRKII